MRIILAAAIAACAASPAAAGQIWLTMDQVRPYQLEHPAGQIVVGNPSIADVTIQDKSNVFLFGKAPGSTNLFIMDDDGNKIEDLVVFVGANTASMVTMHRGSARSTYSCVSKCEPTLTVGDSAPVFTQTQQQIMQKSQQAQSAAGTEN